MMYGIVLSPGMTCRVCEWMMGLGVGVHCCVFLSVFYECVFSNVVMS